MRKFPFAFVLGFIACVHVFAQNATLTEIGGNIEGFLTASKSPYKVTAPLIVAENKALVIDAGVELYFAAGTGLDIRGGAFAAIGNGSQPVKMFAADSLQHWEGIKITGDIRGVFNHVSIQGAKTAIALENASTEIQHVDVVKSDVGVSVKNSNAMVLDATFAENVAGVIVSEGSQVTFDKAEFSKNEIALTVAEKVDAQFSDVRLTNNKLGLLDMGNNSIKEHAFVVEGNEIGVASADLQSENLKQSVNKNNLNFSNDSRSQYLSLPDVAENPYAESYKNRAVDLAAGKERNNWLLSGNVSTEIGYHLVYTNHNHTGITYAFGQDSIAPGDRYENYFRVPGLYSRYNTNLKLESPDNRVFEFTADVESDQWNNWNVHHVNLTYADESNKAILGDMFMNGGEIYMNGFNLFGASYSTGFLKKNDGRHMFEASIYAGETQKPKLVGENNPDVYNDVIENGNAQVQEMVAGGQVTWNMHKRFNGTLGFIGSKGFKEDPFLRDGMSGQVNTIDPEIASRTFFADGHWLFWPGDIELNGQLALGSADTSDAQVQRAVNQVFSAAGLSVENFALLRKLMQDEQKVSFLTRRELEEIFSDNSTMTLSEMRDMLRSLLKSAREILRSYKKRENDPSKISEWDGQNIAAQAGFRWGMGKTILSGHFKYVGSKFYSAGSPDLLSNYRQMDLNLDQRLFDFWSLSLGYELHVENASAGNKYNIFGFKEGSVYGLPFESTSSWEDKHAEDENRAQFIHDVLFKNSFKLSMFDISLKYKLNLRNRNRPLHLYSDYDFGSGVLKDSWFLSDGEGPSYIFDNHGEVVKVDSSRFDQYYGLRDEPFLASRFEERILKHNVELELTLKLKNHAVRVGGTWIYRDDLSEFRNDDLLNGFDFEDRTYGYLGYYFHGADFFEQRYLVSWAVNYDRWRNQLSVAPRYKSYNRDDMSEFEWSLNETFEKVLIDSRLETSLSGNVRQEIVKRHAGEDEFEADFGASGTMTVHYTKDLYSDYTLGAYYCYRPDSRADQYKDFYASFNLNYAF